MAVATGRISVFAEPSAETKAAGKKGGEWVYSTHDLADRQDVLKCIQERMITGTWNGLITSPLAVSIQDDLPVPLPQSLHSPA